MAVITGTGGADVISNTTSPAIFTVEYIDVDPGSNDLEARTLDTYFDMSDGSIDVSTGDTTPDGGILEVNPFGTGDSNAIDPEIQSTAIGYGDFAGHAMRFTTLLHTEGGTYTFDATMYNSAALYIDGVQVFFSENVGAGSATGSITLSEGAHEVVIIYAKDEQGGNSDDLDIDISGAEFGTGVALESSGAVGPLVDDDTITSGSGADTIDASFGDDVINAGSGNDIIDGGGGDDVINAGGGADIVDGGSGDDTIDGRGGADTIDGGDGDDIIEGNGGNDTVTGGAGNDTFIYNAGDRRETITDFGAGSTDTNDGDNTNNDFINLSAFYTDNTEFFADLGDDGILNHSDGSDYSDNDTLNGANNITGLAGLAGISNPSLKEQTGIVCFTKGTRIATPDGAALIEDLLIGDQVLTKDHGPQNIRWIGSKQLSAKTLQDNPKLRPICIQAGALKAGVPMHDLTVSPQHRVLVNSKIAGRMFDSEEMLVAAKQLLAIDGFQMVDGGGPIEYFHILFDHHEIIFANGVAAESLYPGPMTLKMISVEARTEILSIFPELRNANHSPAACRPVADARRARRLAERHQKNGKALQA